MLLFISFSDDNTNSWLPSPTRKPSGSAIIPKPSDHLCDLGQILCHLVPLLLHLKARAGVSGHWAIFTVPLWLSSGKSTDSLKHLSPQLVSTQSRLITSIKTQKEGTVCLLMKCDSKQAATWGLAQLEVDITSVPCILLENWLSNKGTWKRTECGHLEARRPWACRGCLLTGLPPAPFSAERGRC